MRTLVATITLIITFASAHAKEEMARPHCGWGKSFAVCTLRDERMPAADSSPCAFLKATTLSTLKCAKPAGTRVKLPTGLPSGS
jgi:hypothetical protein